MRCRNCGEVQAEVPSQGLDIPPKILYIDIETALMEVYLYDLYIPQRRIREDFIREHSFVINWAAAWLDEDYQIVGNVKADAVTAHEARRKDDRRILRGIWDLMERADYIAGHNSNQFDIKKLKWRFMIHDMGFPLESKKLDSLVMARRETYPPSRKLDALSKALGGNGKRNELEIEEWKAIVARETPEEVRQKLLKKADRYCRNDVREGAGMLRRFAKAIESSGRQVVR